MTRRNIILFIILIVILSTIFIVNFTKKDYKVKLDNEYYNSSVADRKINTDKLNKLINDRSNFILFVYLPYCTFQVSCEDIFASVLTKNKIMMYSIPFDKIKDTTIAEDISYAPSVIVMDKGKVKYFLDPNSDKDEKIYQNEKLFEKWLKKRIKLD